MYLIQYISHGYSEYRLQIHEYLQIWRFEVSSADACHVVSAKLHRVITKAFNDAIYCTIYTFAISRFAAGTSGQTIPSSLPKGHSVLFARLLSSWSVEPHFIGQDIWMKIKSNETPNLSMSFSRSYYVICRISPRLLVDHYSGQEHRSEIKSNHSQFRTFLDYDWHFARVLLLNRIKHRVSPWRRGKKFINLRIFKFEKIVRHTYTRILLWILSISANNYYFSRI